MKMLLALITFASVNAQAATLWVGEIEANLQNYKEHGLDMYTFARLPSKNFCYEGSPQDIIALVHKILDVGTGDSDILERNITAKGKSISVKFDWYDEGGGHITRKVIASCK